MPNQRTSRGRGGARRRTIGGGNIGGILGSIDANQHPAARRAVDHAGKKTTATRIRNTSLPNTKERVARSHDNNSSSSSQSTEASAESSHEEGSMITTPPPKSIFVSKLAGSPVTDTENHSELGETHVSDLSPGSHGDGNGDDQDFQSPDSLVKPRRPLFHDANKTDAYGADDESIYDSAEVESDEGSANDSEEDSDERSSSASQSESTDDTPRSRTSGDSVVQDETSIESEESLESDDEYGMESDDEYVMEEGSSDTEDEELEVDDELEAPAKRNRGRGRKETKRNAAVDESIAGSSKRSLRANESRSVSMPMKPRRLPSRKKRVKPPKEPTMHKKSTSKDGSTSQVEKGQSIYQKEATKELSTEEEVVVVAKVLEGVDLDDEDDDVVIAEILSDDDECSPDDVVAAVIIDESSGVVTSSETPCTHDEDVDRDMESSSGQIQCIDDGVDESLADHDIVPVDDALPSPNAIEDKKNAREEAADSYLALREALSRPTLNQLKMQGLESSQKETGSTDDKSAVLSRRESSSLDTADETEDDAIGEENGPLPVGMDALGATQVTSSFTETDFDDDESVYSDRVNSAPLSESLTRADACTVEESRSQNKTCERAPDVVDKQEHAHRDEDAVPFVEEVVTEAHANKEAAMDSPSLAVTCATRLPEEMLPSDTPLSRPTRQSANDESHKGPSTTSTETSTQAHDEQCHSTNDSQLIQKDKAIIVDRSKLANIKEGALENSIVPYDCVGNQDVTDVQDSSSRPRLRRFRSEGSIKRGKWGTGSKIGVGSFGVVRVGMNKKTGTLMAVKSIVVSTAVMKDIQMEIDLLRQLDHIHIVRYLGAETDGTHLHIFQEWVPGGSVTSLLHKFGSFSMHVVRAYLFQILSGLSYLHDNRILHRDIKGGNVLVSDTGVVKLADFGSSKKLTQQQNDSMENLSMRGTPYFMSPEVFEENYGTKADVWSTACVAFQMATGSPPWKGMGFTNPMALFLHIKDSEGLPSYDWSGMDQDSIAPFKALLEKCFHRDPNLRPTARALFSDPFFTVEQLSSEDNQSRDLFSPGGESISTWGSAHTPIMPTPGRTPRPQSSRSIGLANASFLSPPLPSRIHQSDFRQEVISPLVRSPAPIVDPSEWPSWARERLQDRKSPYKMRPDREASMLPPSSPSRLSDSLALSEDSSTVENPFRRGARKSGDSSMSTSLIGLDFLEGNSQGSQTPGS